MFIYRIIYIIFLYLNLKLSTIIKKIVKDNSKNLYNINLYKNKTKIANYNFIINDNSVTINNLEVKIKNKGIGSTILNNIEKYTKNIYNVNKVNLLAWQDSSSDNVINFFRKNGYKIININENGYDDSLIIYDLYHFEKDI